MVFFYTGLINTCFVASSVVEPVSVSVKKNKEQFLAECKNKNALMVGEWHNLGHSPQYFAEDLLGDLVSLGYKQIVLEFLPFDFDQSVVRNELDYLRDNAELNEKTPYLNNVFSRTNGANDSLFLLYHCLKNEMNLVGCGVTQEQFAEMKKRGVTLETFGYEGAKQIRENSLKIINNLNGIDKTIFYNGGLHNDKDRDVSIVSAVNNRFGKKKSFSVDLVNHRVIDVLVNTPASREYGNRYLKYIKDNNVVDFPTVVDTDHNEANSVYFF